MKTVRTSRAIEHVPDDATIVAGPGCGTPLTLLGELAVQAHRRRGLTLLSGLQLGDYPFLQAVRSGALSYATWHVFGPAREAVRESHVDYLPCRAREVPRLLTARGAEVALIRVTPPDRNGYLSLGPSVSYSLPAAKQASIVIGEVDPTMPRTHGESWLHCSELTLLVDAEQAAPTYDAAAPDATSSQIARMILNVLPRDPVLQLGIGAIPEAVTHALAQADLGRPRFVGMATDAMLDLFDGTLDPRATVPDPAILAVEVMGSRNLLEAVDDHPGIGVYPSPIGHDPNFLRSLPRFVSINSAVEVDLNGQVNAEVVRGEQVSGVGGSTDFVEAATHSKGGLRIVALPATAARGKVSRIVRRLADGVVTAPRQSADIVVTEYGIAELYGRSLTERADALAAIAAPEHRAALTDAPDPPNANASTTTR